MPSHIMDLAAEERIARPACEVFAALRDVEAARAALPRSDKIQIIRLVGEGAASRGDKWRVLADTRLGARSGIVEIVLLHEPSRLGFRAEGRSLRIETSVDVSPDGPDASRLCVSSRLYALSWRSRIAAPAIRLARRRIERAQKRVLRRFRRWFERRGAAS